MEKRGGAEADSKEKAEVPAETAGVALGDIVKIDYSWGELEIFSAPVEYSVRSASDTERTATAWTSNRTILM